MHRAVVLLALVGGGAGLPSTGRAQEPVEVPRAEGRARYTDETTLRDLRERALQSAMREAIGLSLGRQISGLTEFVRQENKDALSEQFTEIIRDASNGVVTRHEILDEGWEHGAPFTDGSSYRVAIKATVRHDPRAAPGAFSMRASLNKSELAVRDPIDTSDEAIISVTASADAFLTVFHIWEDSAEVIFPNALFRQLRIRADEAAEIPPALMRRDANVHLRASLPPSVARRSERLMIVGTTRFLPYDGVAARATADAREVPLIRAELDAVIAWLLAIPPAERAVVDLPLLLVRER